MSQDILEAARTIRLFLSELLSAEEAQIMDAQLAELLNQPNQEKIENLILEILCSYDSTREWINQFLESNSPLSIIEKSYQPTLSPYPYMVSGLIKYACPQGDYIWYQRQVGEPIPNCPTHHIPLEKSPN